MVENHAYARALWYSVASVVAVFTVANISLRSIARSRYLLSLKCSNDRLRNVENPKSSRISSALYSPIAFTSATLRELSYPQPTIFKRWTIFNPPPLGQLYIVAAYMILILILLFRDSIVTGVMYYETIAYRAAWCSVGQLPLIFLLAMKNSIVGTLIGSSHERLNWMHRTVARCLLFTVTIHFSHFWAEWSKYEVVESELKTMPMVKFGMGAYFTLMWIVFSSFAPIRNLRYEFFVVQHIISFIALVVCIFIHVPSYAKVYVWLPIGFYACDRFIRTARMIYHNLSIFHRGSRGVLSCKAHITSLSGQATKITIRNPPLKNWTPGQHVFLQFPFMAPFQSHPFTIASSPSSSSGELTFVVRAHKGFTRRLYRRARSQLPTSSVPSQEKPLTVLLDGPYGAPPNFLQYDTMVLIAGSTGATFTVPILMNALEAPFTSCVRRIEFIWIVKSGTHFEWFADELTFALEFAKERDIQLTITCCVTCDPAYTSESTPFVKPKKCCCCCQDEVKDTPEIDVISIDEKGKETDEISVVSSFSSEAGIVQCNCAAGGEDIPVSIGTGRPDLRAILDINLRLARGETGVAVCGPQGLMAETRTLVAELSDERAAGKGTGAYGVALFAEGFGW
jgi:ferric-chelate reductase